MGIVNVKRKLFFNHRNSYIQPDTHLNYELRRPVVKNEKENLQENQRLLLHSQHKKKKTGNALLLIVQPFLHLFGTQFFPLRLPLCVFVGICLTVF